MNDIEPKRLTQERIDELAGGVLIMTSERDELLGHIAAVEAENVELKGEESYPVTHPIVHIPWRFMRRFEKNAQHNHGQSLKELARRGGLNAAEALAIIHGTWTTAFVKMPEAELRKKIGYAVRGYEMESRNPLLAENAELKANTPEQAIKRLAEFAVENCDDCQMETAGIDDCAWQDTDTESYHNKGFYGPLGECIFQMAKHETRCLEGLE